MKIFECNGSAKYLFFENIKKKLLNIFSNFFFYLKVQYIHNSSLQSFSQDYCPNFSHHLHCVC